jgi:hypothetical protein
MSFRALRALALTCATLAGCGSGSGILGLSGSDNAASVRLVNASAVPLDLATGGVVSATNANIAPGSSVGCISIQDPGAPGLTVRQAGTTTDLAGFAPTFQSGGRYTLVAFPGAGGFVQFLSVPGASLPAAGMSELRVVNASSALGVVDVHATAVGATLGTPNVSAVSFGTASGTFAVTAGVAQVRLTTAGTTDVVFDAGSRTLEAGRSYTLVISSASPSVLVPDC